MWKKTKVLRISRKPSPLQTMKDQEQLENVENFDGLGSIIANDARCAPEIKYRIVMANAASSRNKTLSSRKLYLNLTNKITKCHIRGIAFYGAKIWTHCNVDEKYMQSFKMWYWRKMERISWTECVRNEKVLH
jgi:hypothetical protein